MKAIKFAALFAIVATLSACATGPSYKEAVAQRTAACAAEGSTYQYEGKIKRCVSPVERFGKCEGLCNVAAN